MTTPVTIPQSRVDRLLSVEPTPTQKSLAEYITAATGGKVKVTPKQAQAFLVLHGVWQKSPERRAEKEAQDKARATAKKSAKQTAKARTTKIKVVEDTEGPVRPDDSALQYKVWADEPTPNPSTGELEYAMLPVAPLKTGGRLFEIVTPVNDGADIQVHRKGCADVEKARKQKGFFNIHTVRAHDATHAAYTEISEINNGDGEGHMGYDLDAAHILPCAYEKPAATTRKPRAARKTGVRPAPASPQETAALVKAGMDVDEEITPDMARDMVLETGGSEEEAEAAAMETEFMNEQAAVKPRRTATPRVRKAVKKTATTK